MGQNNIVKILTMPHFLFPHLDLLFPFLLTPADRPYHVYLFQAGRVKTKTQCPQQPGQQPKQKRMFELLLGLGLQIFKALGE